MYSLNKRQMMTIISLSLTAYAFAIAGCGEKKAPDQAAKSADAVTVNSLVGSWVSDLQTPKVGQQNLNFLTITDKSIKLKVVCIIEAKENLPAVNASAEIANSFSVEAKNMKFTEKREKVSDAAKACVASIIIGNVRFSVEADKLILGLKADGTPEADAKVAGISFKKIKPEQIESMEKDLIAKSSTATSPAALRSAVLDAAAAANKDGAKAGAQVNQALVGMWVMQAEDQKVKEKLGTSLSKINFGYIRFDEKQNKFIERLACRWTILAAKKDAQTEKVIPPIERGFKLNRLHLADATNDIHKETMNFDADGILFETMADKPSIKIKKAIGSELVQVLTPDLITLSPEELAITNCQNGYSMDQEISFEISKDSKTLFLTDDPKDENSKGRREFHRFDEKNPDHMEINRVIMKNTKEAKVSATPLIEPKIEPKIEAGKPVEADDPDDTEEAAAAKLAADADAAAAAAAAAALAIKPAAKPAADAPVPAANVVAPAAKPALAASSAAPVAVVVKAAAPAQAAIAVAPATKPVAVDVNGKSDSRPRPGQ